MLKTCMVMPGNRKILDVPLISQRYASDCGVACIAMIATYDGQPFPYKKIAKELGAHKKSFTGMRSQDIGNTMLALDYDVKLQTMNSDLFSVDQAYCSQDEIRDHVKWLYKKRYKYEDEDDREDLKNLARFIHDGGEMLIRIPAEFDLVNEIDKGRPVIAEMTNGFMGANKKLRVGYNQHLVTVIGYDWQGFFVNDPEPYCNQGTMTRYKATEMMFAIYNHSGTIIKAAPKPLLS